MTKVEFFMLVSIEPGANESEIATRLSEFDEVDNQHLLYSNKWKIIIHGSAKAMSTLKEFTIKKLRKIEGIHSTKTLIVAGEEKN